MSERRDRGYAMVAAVAGIAAFAMIAFETLAANRGAIASVAGQYENAKLAAAADAGVAAAVYGLSIPDKTLRWTIDGRVRTLSFEGTSLSIFVEDEHGKIPVNRLNEDQVRQMFAAAGVTGKRLDTLTDCFEDWQDEDDDKRPNGAEAPDYVSLGIKPRNGDLRTIGEMAQIKGMDNALFARLAPAVTVFFGETGAFSVEDAQPLALAVLSGTGTDSPDVIERQRELAGEKPALDTAKIPDINLTGRPVTIRVLARDAAGGSFQRNTIVEITGAKANPFWVRYVD